MTDIDYNLVVEYLGKPHKQGGGYSKWQCPFCGDKGKDNLIYTHKTGTLWCYADDSHAPALLKNIFSKNKEHTYKLVPKVIKSEPIKIELTQKRQEEFVFYMLECNYELLQDKKSLDFLLARRGISRFTVEYCGIGIDKSERRWVFPTYKYSCDSLPKLFGFEYRPLNLSKNGLYREKNTPTCMAMINSYTNLQKVLVIVEGYLDGYAFVDHLANTGQLKFYHVITPSNGVSNVVKLLKAAEYNFDKYKKIYAYLDSDEVSLPKAEALKIKYPFIEVQHMPCGCKDFNEHYLKCILKRSIS